MLHSYLRKSKAASMAHGCSSTAARPFRDFIRVNKDSQRLIKAHRAGVRRRGAYRPLEPRTAAKHTSNAEQSLHALEKLVSDVSIEDSAKKRK